MSPFVLVSTGEKKSFSIDLRAPTPPTPFDVDDAMVFFFFDTREKKREGRCKVKVESCGDCRTDGSVNFEFCWPFSVLYESKGKKREGERTSCHL